MTSRSFLGSKAGNEPKDSSAYKKVEGSQERPSIAAAATAADEEDAAPRESVPLADILIFIHTCTYTFSPS